MDLNSEILYTHIGFTLNLTLKVTYRWLRRGRKLYIAQTEVLPIDRSHSKGTPRYLAVDDLILLMF